MFCNHCGIKVEGDPLFCPNCGEKLPLRQVKSRYPLWLRWLFGLAVIGLIISLFFFLTEPEPEKTVIDQLESLKNHGLTEAYYGYTSNEFQEATSLEKFKEVLRSFPYLMQVSQVKVLEQEIKDSLATLKLALTSEEGRSFTMEYQLIKDEGKWKILYFKLLKEPAAQSDLQFDQILVSEKATDKGEVISPSETIKNPSGPLFVNLVLSHATKGDFITLMLASPELKIQSPPLEHIVENTAKRYVAYFTFSPPTAGWPKGTYLVVARSQKGSEKSFNFIIE